MIGEEHHIVVVVAIGNLELHIVAMVELEIRPMIHLASRLVKVPHIVAMVAMDNRHPMVHQMDNRQLTNRRMDNRQLVKMIVMVVHIVGMVVMENRLVIRLVMVPHIVAMELNITYNTTFSMNQIMLV